LNVSKIGLFDGFTHKKPFGSLASAEPAPTAWGLLCSCSQDCNDHKNMWWKERRGSRWHDARCCPGLASTLFL